MSAHTLQSAILQPDRHLTSCPLLLSVHLDLKSSKFCGILHFWLSPKTLTCASRPTSRGKHARSTVGRSHLLLLGQICDRHTSHGVDRTETELRVEPPAESDAWGFIPKTHVGHGSSTYIILQRTFSSCNVQPFRASHGPRRRATSAGPSTSKVHHRGSIN